MTPNEYIHNVMRTDAGPNPKSRERAHDKFGDLEHQLAAVAVNRNDRVYFDASRKGEI